ncbi:MAG: glycosyltransferase, partial [Flavobacteriaceae bacterium]|nr:glycosyltransferase [Flavobacteriaceae bacterium]
PKQLIIVNDNSSDATETIVKFYLDKYPWIKLINIKSTPQHLPGSKVINAFYKGLESTSTDYDIICKFDADLIFPNNYLETLAAEFKSDSKLGMVAGFCYVEEYGKWILEDLTRKDHIRGALKAYRKDCFKDIGGLKVSMGWDTIDELLAKYHGWSIKTIPNLKVKHLKPTGKSYDKSSKFLQGQAMYKMRYGLIITLISALKLAFKKGRPLLFLDYIRGYFKARKSNSEYLVSEDEGKFIRKTRWNGMLRR